jgi:hypothetical protein
MKTRFLVTCRVAAGFVVAAMLLASAAAAQGGEEKKPPSDPARSPAVWVEVPSAEPPFWIGVMATPVDPLLKTHLRIAGGLVVQHVVPDSPAHKAGVRENDILLKFADKPVTSVPELLTQVGATKEQAAPLTLLREGREQTLQVTPAKRPPLAMLPPLPPARDPDSLRKWAERMQRGEMDDWPRRMLMLRPGIVLPDNMPEHFKGLFLEPGGRHKKLSLLLPQNTAITVTKPQEGPVRIVVKKDGQTWEVGEDELDKLPEDVRAIVKGMLGRDGALSVFGDGSGFRLEMRDGHAAPDKGKRGEKKPDGVKKDPAAKGHADAVLKKLDEVNRQLDEQRKRLQDEVEKLRKDVERMKSKAT